MTIGTNWGTFEGILGVNPIVSPYIAQIPTLFRQGDSATWTDRPLVDPNGVAYDAANYVLKYTLAGPTAPLVLTAVADGPSWVTTLTTTQSEALTAGRYAWCAQLFATDVRITIAEGELTVEADLSSVAAGFDPRSQAEIALDQARAAYANFSSSGGAVQSYRIGSREMVFHTLADIQSQVNYWQSQVTRERRRGNSNRLSTRLRFERAR